jgi:amicyanin
MSNTRNSSRRWIIGGSIAVVVLVGLYFGIAQIIQNREVAQAQNALKGTPVLGVTQVDLTNYAFSPPNIQVTQGTTITWTNRDNAAHNVSFDQGGIASPTLKSGQTFSYTFKTPGVYTYRCTFHPGMLGKVTVTP